MIARLRRALAGPHPVVLRVLMDLAFLFVLAVFGKALALEAIAAADANQINWNTIATLFFTFLTAVVTGVMAIYVAKMKTVAQETKVAQVATGEVIKEVHTAVNTNYQRMAAELEKLRDIVSGLTKDKSVLQTEAQASAVEKAVADTKLLAAAEQRPSTLAAPQPAQPVTVVNKEPVPVDVKVPKGPTP